jgi:Ribonucleotide reductase, barrel domain
LFAVVYARRVFGRVVIEVQRSLEQVARDRGFLNQSLLAEIAATGTVRGNPAVPPDVQRAYVTALEVAPRWHVRMQAAVQRHVDAAVSKTVNLPADATAAHVEAIFLDAWRAGCKGITVGRHGTRPGQMLQRVPTDVQSLPGRLADPSDSRQAVEPGASHLEGVERATHRIRRRRTPTAESPGSRTTQRHRGALPGRAAAHRRDPRGRRPPRQCVGRPARTGGCREGFGACALCCQGPGRSLSSASEAALITCLGVTVWVCARSATTPVGSAAGAADR